MCRVLVLVGTLILASSVILAGGCAAPTPTPTPTKAPAAPAKPAAAPTATTAPAPTKAPAAPTQAPKPAPTPTTVAERPLSPPVKMRVGILGSAVDSGVLIPYDKGWFKAQGLDVELVPFSSAALMNAPLGTGQLEAGGGGVSVGLFNTILRGVPLKIVADKMHVEPGNRGTGWLVRKELLDKGIIKTPADLKGRVIALPSRGSTQEHMLEIMLSQVGLTIDDLEIKILGYPDQITAFANGAIDMGHNFEPNVTTAIEMKVADLWKLDHDLLPNRQGSVMVYAPEFAEKYPEAARRFMVEYVKGVRVYNDAFFKNKGLDDVIGVLSRLSTQKDPAILRKLSAQPINPDGYVFADALQRDIDYFVRTGGMKEPLDAKKIIDNQYVDYAGQKLGKYQR